MAGGAPARCQRASTIAVATDMALEVLSLTATRSGPQPNSVATSWRAPSNTSHSLVASVTGLSSQAAITRLIAARTLFAIGTCPPDQAKTWSSR